jgi:hypothetical protein
MNADSADDGTPRGRVYSRLMHLQVDLQEENDEEAENILLDEVLDPFWHNYVNKKQ